VRTVVLVSYHFPPYGGKAVQRASKLAKYLPVFGWRPVVLTLPLRERHVPIDESLLDELPDCVEIHRPEYRDWRRAIPHDVRRLLPAPKPDKYRAWARGGWRSLATLIRDSGADAMISTSPTHSAQILALRAREATGVPWVADFRDPWTGDPSLDGRSAAKEMFELETRVAASADAVVGVCPKILRDFADRVAPGRLHLIENGYDEQDFDDVDWDAPPAERAALVIGYNGTLSARHNPEPLLESMQRLLDGGAIDPGEIRVVFTTTSVGNERLTRYPELVESGMLVVRDYVPHSRSLADLARLDVSLLLLTGGEGHYPAKLFEYLRIGNPILPITFAGDDLGLLLVELEAGPPVDPQDVDGIGAALLELRDRKRSGGLPHLAPDLARVDRFSRKRIAERYAELLDAIAG